jgi:hypothetical protein
VDVIDHGEAAVPGDRRGEALALGDIQAERLLDQCRDPASRELACDRQVRGRRRRDDRAVEGEIEEIAPIRADLAGIADERARAWTAACDRDGLGAGRAPQGTDIVAPPGAGADQTEPERARFDASLSVGPSRAAPERERRTCRRRG